MRELETGEVPVEDRLSEEPVHSRDPRYDGDGTPYTGDGEAAMDGGFEETADYRQNVWARGPEEMV